jgi:hypothetical protein
MPTFSAAAESSGTKTLYLPGVEANPQPGVYQSLIAAAKNANSEYSKIWDLFAFQQGFTTRRREAHSPPTRASSCRTAGDAA